MKSGTIPENMLIDCLARTRRWVKRVVAGFGLCKIDPTAVPEAPGEIRLFMVTRNESLRLPYLLRYYFAFGVNRAFVIDNGSTDATADFLLSQDRTHVFQTKASYERYPIWIDYLLHRFGRGHWCVIVDADELLVYPQWETLSLKDLCSFLDQEGATALHCSLLDMYSNKSIRATTYKQGDDPRLSARFFDPESYERREFPPRPRSSQKFVFAGGVRKRVFGIDVCLSKFPLVKFGTGIHLHAGTHFIEGARIAGVEGSLLHFKFLSDFPCRVAEEIEREQHWNNAVEYKAYTKKMKAEPDLSMFYPKSVKFGGSSQLLNLGIMKTSVQLDDFAAKMVRKTNSTQEF